MISLQKLKYLRPSRFGLFRYSDPNFLNLHFMSGDRATLTDWQGLHAYHGSAHLKAEPFSDIYERATALDPNLPRETLRLRVYNVVTLGEVALKRSGDILLAGLSHGVMPRAFLERHRADLVGRTVWIADPLNGTLARGNRCKTSAYDADFAGICTMLATFANVKIAMGYIPDVLNEITSREFCFIHMDTGDSASEVESLPWMRRRMGAGSVMVIDSFNSKPALAERYSSILGDLGLTVLPLMNCQAACFA